MDDLATLHEASILDNIELRFRMDRIYTNSGPILIAMNPFKWLPIYGEEVIKSYHNRPYGTMEPHCYNEAEAAFQNLVKTHKDQSVVICGESGAGKTETTKLMLQYLSAISLMKQGGECAGGLSMGQKIVASNPLLEAFGNAKTLRNNNSSRFGKFTSLNYSPQHFITGSKITNLLLEKSRITFQPGGERNFHVYYQLQSSAMGKQFGLSGNMSQMFYTGQSGCTTVSDMNDSMEFDETIKSMKAIDMADSEIQNVMRIVAAVLHMGNVNFTKSDKSAVDSASSSVLQKAGELLGINGSALGRALVTRVRVVADQVITSDNDQEQSVALRDAVAKSVYSKLFDWIVMRVNYALDKDDSDSPAVIGVLDIFGFEDMDNNGFEQLFINTTNEMLQKVFNDIIFKEEAEEYNREQIDWDPSVFPDNDPCIHLLTKRPIGLMPYLDSECARGTVASDGAELTRKLNKSHAKNEFYEVCGPASVYRRKDQTRTQHEDFLIHHYAGPIIYTVKDFIQKNRDSLFDHVYDVLSETKDQIIQDLYPVREEDSGDQLSQTVGRRFLGQLQYLVQMLRESETRFVRCIKTNHQYQPQSVDKNAVLNQLICSGVMAALEVRRAGYPSRMTYREFVREFRVFSGKGRTSDDRQLAEKMFQHAHVRGKILPSQFRFGVTKVFMQADVMYTLQAIKNNLIYPFVRRLQIWWQKKQGDIVLLKIRRGTNALAVLEQHATTNQVAHVPMVAEELNCIRESLARAQASHKREDVTELMKACDACSSAIDISIAQKEEAYRIRAEVLAGLDEYSARVQSVKSHCATLYDPASKARLEAACKEAEDALNKCRDEQLVAANRWDKTLMDTNNATGAQRRELQKRGNLKRTNSFSDGNEKAARNQRMEGAKQKVPVLEDLCAGFLQQKVAMDSARAEYQDAVEHAADRLDAIPVDQFIIAGIKNVQVAVVAAREAIYTAQRALMSVDAEAFKLAVRDCVNAVNNALEVSAREHARVEAMENLDNAEAILKGIEATALEEGLNEMPATGLKTSVAATRAQIEYARSVCNDPSVSVLQEATEGALHAVNNTAEMLESELEKKRAADRARFNKLFGMWSNMDSETSTSKAPPQKLSREQRKSSGRVKSFKHATNAHLDDSAPAVTMPAPAPAPAPRYTAPVVKKQLPTPPPKPFKPKFNAAPTTTRPSYTQPAPAPVARQSYTSGRAAIPTSSGGDITIQQWVAENKLDKYSLQICMLAGEVQDLREFNDSDCADLIKECGIPKMAARRLHRALNSLGANVSLLE
jgi:myosin heavy subunit